MLLQSVLAVAALLPLVASAPQGCHHGHCRSSSAIASATSETEEASSTYEAPAPTEDSDDGGDDITPTTTAIGSDETPFSTTADPAASSVPSTSGGGKKYWTPTMSDTFVVDLENDPIPSNAASVYVVDLAHTKEQIAAYKADGKHVSCYFSAGAWDPYRDDKLLFKPECYCGPGQTGRDETTGVCTSDITKQPDWDAYWFDIKTPACLENIKEVHTARMVAAYEKGCDAIDPDNVDGAFNQQNAYGNTPANQMDFNLWLAKTAHDNGLAIDLKNAPGLIQYSADYSAQLVEAFDYNVIESCHVYDECGIYEPFLKAGKPQIQLEYVNKLAEAEPNPITLTSCYPAQEGVGLALYPTTKIDSSQITLSCPK